MWRRWQKSRRQRQTTALNHRISRGSIETAIPSSRPERCNADARSGGQGRPKGAARRREASLTVASTAASWARRDATATRVNHHENPFTPMDVLRPRLAPNQHIQPVIAKPHPGKRCLAASRRGARPTAPSMRGFSPPLTSLGLLAELLDGSEDFIRGFGPSIRLGIFIVPLDEGSDTRDALAVVQATNGQIDVCFYSDRFKDLGRLPFIKKGTPLPHSTLTREFHKDEANIRHGVATEDRTRFADWFGIDGPEVREQVKGLGTYGKTLILPSCDVRSDDEFNPDDQADDDECLREHWTPRFHR